MIRAAMMTMTDTIHVDLLDLSTSGARLRGHDFPSPGQEVILLIGRLEAFGAIVWRDEDQCGVHFESALSDDALLMAENERGQSLAGFTSENALAAGDWLNGLAR